MSKNILYILLFVAVSSCYSGSQGSSSIFDERLSAYSFNSDTDLPLTVDGTIEINESDLRPSLPKASQIYQNRSYIELQTPDDIIIGKVSKILVQEDLMLILDRFIAKTAFLFKTNGEFLFEVGIDGQGPGEHDDIIDISFKENSIIVMDLRFRLYEYDFSNNFIKTTEIPFYSHGMHVFRDGSMAFTNNEVGHPELGYQILMLEDQKITKRLFRNEGMVLSGFSSNPTSSNKLVHGDKFLFTKPWGNEVYEVSNDRTHVKYKVVSDELMTLEILNNQNKFEVEEFNKTYIFNAPILENEEVTILRVMSNQRIITIVYNKVDDSIKSYNGLSDDFLYGGVSDFPLYVEGNDFYVPLNVEQMYIYKKKIEESTDPELMKGVEKWRPEFFQLMANLTETSNPIIMKCEMQ